MEARALPSLAQAPVAPPVPSAASPAIDEATGTGSSIVYAELIGGRIDGARIVSRLGSDLILGSAPLDEVELLLARPEFRSAAYLISLVGGAELGLDLIETGAADATPDLPVVKVGETNFSTRRWREHRRRPPVAADRVWLVATLRPHGFGKDALLALQYALTHQAIRASRCRVVGAKPEKSWLAKIDPGLMQRWLLDARALLVGGGCHLLEPRGAWMRPPVVVGLTRTEVGPEADVVSPAGPVRPALPPLKRGYRLAPAYLAAEPGAARRILSWRGVHVVAVEQNDGSVVIEAGALFSVKARSGVQTCIARKLERMGKAGLFEPAGEGVRRLTRAIQVSTLTNALRLATISNLPGKGRWMPAS